MFRGSPLQDSHRELYRKPQVQGTLRTLCIGKQTLPQPARYKDSPAHPRTYGPISAESRHCWITQRLDFTVKTPVLRDLEDSAPYFHNGRAATLDDVVNHYILASQLAHSGQMRKAPQESRNMSLSPHDSMALVAFLQSLTEDYDDT